MPCVPGEFDFCDVCDNPLYPAKRFWFYRGWAFRPFLGSDEFHRTTICIPLVFARLIVATNRHAGCPCPRPCD